ncbi:MAG: hypothetical protein IJ890_02570 [Clostridia bacterium]|nr:hypothetical protein [Clostridia bacterium]
MQIGNKLFPYPTINNSNLRSCFKETTYSFKSNDYNDGQNYVLEDACIEINNENIKKMIEENQLGVGLIIECSSTVYRKMFEITTEPQTIKIPIGDLRDKVEISCYIYAKMDLESFNDNDFLDDYNGYSFKIDKNDIVAIDDGYTTIIDYDESIDKKVSSIFQIIRDKSADSMIIEKKAKKIVISLPEEEFTYYDSLRKNDNFQNIFFSMIAIPALTYCLKEFQDTIRLGDYDLDSIEMEYNWFISVKNAYKKQYGIELTENILKNEDVSIISQKLLNDGNLNGIKDLFNISVNRKLYGGEDDE